MPREQHGKDGGPAEKSFRGELGTTFFNSRKPPSGCAGRVAGYWTLSCYSLQLAQPRECPRGASGGGRWSPWWARYSLAATCFWYFLGGAPSKQPEDPERGLPRRDIDADVHRFRIYSGEV